MEFRSLFILLVSVVSLTIASRHDIYARHSVHGIVLRDRFDLKLLQLLEANHTLDVWQHGVPSQRDAMVMVTPEEKDDFLNVLDVYGLSHYLHLADVAKGFEEFDANYAKYQATRTSRQIYNDFPRHDEVNEYLESLAAQYPNLVTLVNAGLSYEGRQIKYLKISTTNFNDPSKPIYFMDAMIHAREWVTTPVALYSLHRLLEDLRTEDQDLLNDINWIVLPVVNPDGYEFTHTDERLWRKTRSLNLGVSTCYGIDANRNFDAEFNTIGVSNDPCQNTYPGTVAFSEPETQYVRDIMFEYLDRIQIYMNIHSYGNYILYGYGSAVLPPNALHLHHVGSAMGAAIDARRLPTASYYLVGNSNLALYGSSGSAQDYGQLVGIPFSYTLELPGYNYDFRVPVEYQPQINEETWQGIAESARLAKLYYDARYTASQNNK